MKALSVLTASVLLIGASFAANATPVGPTDFLFQIDDLTDTVTTTAFINGIAQTPTTATESGSIFPSWIGSPSNFTGSNSYNIYDPGGVTLSDTYSQRVASFTNIATGVTETDLSASFLSDGNGNLTPLNGAPSLIETGDWQTVTTFSILDAAGVVADTVTVQFRSDVETPLPAALPLFATGIGALGLLGWHRKRKNVGRL